MWRSIARRVLLGARCLARSLGPWPFLLVLAWALVTRLQEPDFLHRQEVPFYWDSLEALMVLAVATLPLVWRWTQDPAASVLRSENALSDVLAGFLAVVAYGALLLGASLALGFSVERIIGSSRDLGGAARLAGAGMAMLAVMASFAPVLAAVRWPSSWVVCAWLVAAFGALVLVGPAGAPEFSPRGLATAWIPGMLSVVAATLGGLGLSLAQQLRHTHADRNPRRHP